MFTGTLTTGDGYVKQQQLGDIDFVKIDVEVAEPLVLKGFRETIEAGRLHCVQLEYGASRFKRMSCSRTITSSSRSTTGLLNIDVRDYDWRMEIFRFCNFLSVA